MARLSHPNVAVAYEVGMFQGHVFLSMEFVDGMDRGPHFREDAAGQKAQRGEED